jgi:hypothetical protein
MHFVAFHVEPSAAGAARITESCSAFHADTNYRRLLTILFASVELFHAGATPAVLSDEHTPLDFLPPNVKVRRYRVDPDRITYSRVVAQVDYMQSLGVDSPVFFLDSDMIVNADLAPLSAEECDLALTYRNHPEMPLNGGLILVRGGSAGRGARFLEHVRATYASQFSSSQHWWGDQLALIAAVGRKRFESRKEDLLTVDGVRIRLLPCAQYNFSPDNRIRSISHELRDKCILHFKGERKRLMPLYWNTYLAPSTTVAGRLRLDRFWRQQSLRLRDYRERAASNFNSVFRKKAG